LRALPAGRLPIRRSNGSEAGRAWATVVAEVGYSEAMTETIKPDPTDPADSGTDEASKPQPDESFLEPGDATSDETDAPGRGDSSNPPQVPPPPD
jgi:hypothetical protein